MKIRGITASNLTLGQDVHIGDRSRIHAQSVVIGDNVSIADDVTIACDEIAVGSGTRIGPGSTIVSPRVRLGERCSIGAGLRAELNEAFECGRLGDIGQSVRITGHAMRAGDHLWLTDHIVIGGGGARGLRSTLDIGHRCAVMDRCYINLSEAVTIGDDTALSNGVTLLTHSLWQPVLSGGTSQFAPVVIGSRCILYVNAIVVPGVSIGSDCTIAAGALVMQNVPDAATAIGNPARIMRSTPPMPRELTHERQDAILREVLAGWADTLPVKGLAATFDPGTDTVTVRGQREHEVVRYLAHAGSAAGSSTATVTLAFGPAAQDGTCHFDLAARAISGTPSSIAEDLRDYLRRRTIRICTDRPFTALRPAAIERLRRALQHADD